MHTLYSHQAQALEHVRAGRDVVVATPTASGKSLVYHLAVLAACAEDAGARALYLFPTKALAHDQVVSLDALATACGWTRGPTRSMATRRRTRGGSSGGRRGWW
ncbi:MAG: DEAD/DEAH box helicase [bacterium]